jgi:hypothetical protein
MFHGTGTWLIVVCFVNYHKARRTRAPAFMRGVPAVDSRGERQHEDRGSRGAALICINWNCDLTQPHFASQKALLSAPQNAGAHEERNWMRWLPERSEIGASTGLRLEVETTNGRPGGAPKAKASQKNHSARTLSLRRGTGAPEANKKKNKHHHPMGSGRHVKRALPQHQVVVVHERKPASPGIYSPCVRFPMAHRH